MNEAIANALTSKVNELRASGVSLLSWKQANESPDFKEFGQNRGLRLRFNKGDILHFPSLEKAVFFTTSFKSGGKTYQVLKTLAVVESSAHESLVREVPAAIFCRIPALETEQELLWKDNSLGYRLASLEADYLRLQLLCETGDIKVTWASGRDGEPDMHTDRWYTDKDTGDRVCVHDSEDLPAKDRIRISCYRFSAM